jgi:hypothetical protein
MSDNVAVINRRLPIDIVGLVNDENGRGYALHDTCGKYVHMGDTFVLKRVVITRPVRLSKEETKKSKALAKKVAAANKKLLKTANQSAKSKKRRILETVQVPSDNGRRSRRERCPIVTYEESGDSNGDDVEDVMGYGGVGLFDEVDFNTIHFWAGVERKTRRV